MDYKKLLLPGLFGCVLGATAAVWLTLGTAQEQHDKQAKQCAEKIQTLNSKLDAYCSGQEIGPGVRATHIQCGEKEEICICGTPRR